MVSCVCCGCSSTKHNKENGITFHMFPKNAERRAKWIRFVNKDKWDESKRSFICSQHFPEDSFDRSSSLKVQLRETANPSIYVERLKYVRNYNYTILHEDKASLQAAECVVTNKLVPNSKTTTARTDSSPPTLSCASASVSTSPQRESKSSSQADTPRKSTLKRKINELKSRDILRSKKIRKLQHTNWRQRKRIQNLTTLVKQLENKNFLNEDNVEVLLQKFGKNKDLIKRIFAKETGRTVTKRYSRDLRSFAVTLHFFSAKAYNYVRQRFGACLPHPKTLSKWYSSVDSAPGITSEALKILKLKTKYSTHPIYCSLVMDEMSIREHVEWDGQRFHGLVGVGNSLQEESVGIAKEALVFMIVAINESWKLPIAYFFIKGINSNQKAEIVKQCLHALKDTGVIITNITFDGCPANFTMAKILGCDLQVNKLSTNCGDSTYILPDPSHMVKLIRNTFGEYKQLKNKDNHLIDFVFVTRLHSLQEHEGLHLANKLKKAHILYFKQKMKVKLATQLLSRSVAEALMFCKNNLKLAEFQNCDATVEFILMFNDAFDILNSRKLSGYKFKKALCHANVESVKLFYNNFFNYIAGLKLLDGTAILESKRKTGFLGFLIAFHTVLSIFDKYIDAESPFFKFLPLYKCSQDHLELFFGGMRSHGGHNNNPTCRQFTAAYKKILVHAEIRDGGVGNCVPLDEISILNCVSSTKKPEEIINDSAPVLYKDVSTDYVPDISLSDHEYIFDIRTLSEYTNQIIIYISGCVSYKLGSVLKCEPCVTSLLGEKEDLLQSFVHFKNKGRLTYPSNDVIQICTETEKILRVYIHSDIVLKIIKHKVTQQVLIYSSKKNIFCQLQKHCLGMSVLENHSILLIKSIVNYYLDVRLYYIGRQLSVHDSVRNHLTHLILFRGQ